MSQHTFCRARPLKQEPCSAQAALKIVQDMLAAGTSNLADDVRANLHNVEAQLQVVQGFPEDLSDGRPAAAPRGVANGGAAAGPGSKKESKKDKKAKEGGVTPAAEGGKEKKDKGKDKKEKKDKEEKKKEKKKRIAEDGDGGEEKKKKKQKTEK